MKKTVVSLLTVAAVCVGVLYVFYHTTALNFVMKDEGE